MDGNVHFFPSDSDHVLQIDIATGECREVGPDLRGVEAMQQNKWQNGFTSGDFLYGIPLKGNSVIRYVTLSEGARERRSWMLVSHHNRSHSVSSVTFFPLECDCGTTGKIPM